jgi:hypothetical protein
MCAANGTGTAYLSGIHEFTTGFWCGLCYSIFSFMCMFCRLPGIMAVTIPPNIVYANTLVKWLTEILHYKYSEACLNRTLNKLQTFSSFRT